MRTSVAPAPPQYAASELDGLFPADHRPSNEKSNDMAIVPDEMVVDEPSKSMPGLTVETSKEMDTDEDMDLVLRPSTSSDNQQYYGGSITSHGSLAQKMEEVPTPVSVPKPKTTTTPTATGKSLLSPKSRLVQPTAASKRHNLSADKRSGSTPVNRPGSRAPVSGKRSSPSGIPVPSTVRIATGTNKRPATKPAQSKSRFMQPTEAKRAHDSDVADAQHAPKRAAVKHRAGPPSRLMRGTAATSSRTGKTATSSLPQKREASDDAVARARERVRLRKLEETKRNPTNKR